MMIDYFSEAEFERCVPKCKKSDMDSSFMARLNKARRMAGIPFVLNSAYRTVEHEKLMNRSGNSMHTKGRAVDIRCLDGNSRFVMVNALLRCGFNGIGISNTFIHVDDRQIKTFWLYE